MNMKPRYRRPGWIPRQHFRHRQFLFEIAFRCGSNQRKSETSSPTLPMDRTHTEETVEDLPGLPRDERRFDLSAQGRLITCHTR